MGFEIGTDGPSRILVCIDGSETSLRAGSYAAGMARREGCQLVVAYVANQPALVGLAPGLTAAAQQTLDELTEDIRVQVQSAASWAGVTATFLGLRGEPYAEICKAAEKYRVDAVVVGASAQAGHRFVGSLAVKLVRAGKWPVTVVP